MTQYIDFLPESHRRKRKRRRTKRWRQAVMIVFLAIVGVGGAHQHRVRVTLQKERDQLASQDSVMNRHLPDPAALRKKVDELDQRANLATHLRLRTPPTRILAAVTNSLPELVSLTEYRSAFMKPEPDGKQIARPRRKNEPAKRSSIQQDLATLRTARRERPLTITIKGLAADDLSISRFLANLQKSAIFDDVRLMYTDKAEFERHPMRGFGIRLTVRTIAAPAGTARSAAVSPAASTPESATSTSTGRTRT